MRFRASLACEAGAYALVMRCGASAHSFLVQESALGTSRAACVAALLKELNDSVAGAYVEEEPAQLLASDPAFFKEFSLVIATQVHASRQPPPGIDPHT